MRVPVYEPYFIGNEKKYVQDCIETTWISSKGKYIDQFEKEFSRFTKIRYSNTVSNGTTALHLALLALGISNNEEVIVPTFTYIASVNAIKYVGATPIFVDSDPLTWQIDLLDLEKKITDKTKAVIAVHLYGNVLNIKKLKSLCNKYNLLLIEDCAEAIGSYYNDIHVGNFGDIATFSFYGNKTITTGEGGMVCTNDIEFSKKVRLYRGQGVSETIEYWHEVIGYNYRMTNICAAIGLAQLEGINEILSHKKRITALYKKLLEDLPISFAIEEELTRNSNWMIAITVDSENNRNNLREYLNINSIETRPFFIPIHCMEMYCGAQPNDFPVAMEISRRGLNLPSSPTLNDERIYYVCKIIRDFFESKDRRDIIE
ncbi:perosamine synthetase [Niallia circulans]|uniref:DegT/DnrJ/EryC1/StrS family aminotransferase n=1 Tax=Niallia circulans TaxID=1397 RepID=UPI00201DF93E|nr:DegT/DnrJ/EryC1/StrS aminotransferase family protein [Niallia circulans]UQZ76066.1 perosamine synthetase [Niallia circulans]